MSILDIIYNIVNKSKGEKEEKKDEKQEEDLNSKPNTKTQQESKEKLEQKIVLEDMSNTKELIDSWDQTVKTVSNHPLSQVKVINNQVLEQLTTILTSMNQKLEKLDKLDEILELLKESRKEVRKTGGSMEKLDKAISEMENLTIKDEKVIEVIEDKGPQSAESLADYIGVSRSTASSRLNRLHKKNVLRKETEGRKVFFSLLHKKDD